MKETLESLPPEPESKDKKNYTTKGAEQNFISANNSTGNFTTIVDEKQSRINTAVNFFNILYGKITAPHFAYLWTKQRGIFSFFLLSALMSGTLSIPSVSNLLTANAATKTSFLIKSLVSLTSIFVPTLIKARTLLLPSMKLNLFCPSLLA